LFFLSPRFDEEETVDQAWGNFVKPIEAAMQLFVSPKTIVACQSNKSTKRYSGLIRHAMTKKRRLTLCQSLEIISSICQCTKYEVSTFSHSKDIKGIPKFRNWSRDLSHAPVGFKFSSSDKGLHAMY